MAGVHSQKLVHCVFMSQFSNLIVDSTSISFVFHCPYTEFVASFLKSSIKSLPSLSNFTFRLNTFSMTFFNWWSSKVLSVYNFFMKITFFSTQFSISSKPIFVKTWDINPIRSQITSLNLSPSKVTSSSTCKGWNIRFFGL